MAKYIDVDRLKEEFQKRFDICKRVSEDDRNALDTQDWYRGKYTAYSECLSFIDSLSEEPDKSLEEAAEEYFYRNWSDGSLDIKPQVKEDFIAGAEWQKERFEAEYELDWITDLKKDLYELGRKDEREQMMKEAVEAKIYGYDDGSFELIASWLDMPNNSIYKDGDKVRIIIVKEEENK